MIDSMKNRFAKFFAAGVLFLGAPAMAQDDDADKSYDARLEGHNGTVQLDGGSSALTFLLLAGLGILAIGVTFKSGKRTHLD